MTSNVGSNPFPWLNGKVISRVAFKVEDEKIHLETEVASHVTRETVNLKDRATKEVLLKIGWLPPELKEVLIGFMGEHRELAKFTAGFNAKAAVCRCPLCEEARLFLGQEDMP